MVRKKKHMLDRESELKEERTQSLKSKEYHHEKRKLKPLKIKKEERCCENCGTKFIWSSSKPNKIHCTIQCGLKYHKELYKNMQKGLFIKRGKTQNYLRLRFEIFKRDFFTCQYCGRSIKEHKIVLNCDHIHPKAKGGEFKAKNLTTSCEECNLGKSDVLLEDRKLKRKNEQKTGGSSN